MALHLDPKHSSRKSLVTAATLTRVGQLCDRVFKTVAPLESVRRRPSHLRAQVATSNDWNVGILERFALRAFTQRRIVVSRPEALARCATPGTEILPGF